MRILYDAIPEQVLSQHAARITDWIGSSQPFDLRLALNAPDGRGQPFVFVHLKKTELVSRYAQEPFLLIEPLTRGDAAAIAEWSRAFTSS